jgi:hypothetical protein
VSVTGVAVARLVMHKAQCNKCMTRVRGNVYLMQPLTVKFVYELRKGYCRNIPIKTEILLKLVFIIYNHTHLKHEIKNV